VHILFLIKCPKSGQDIMLLGVLNSRFIPKPTKHKLHNQCLYLCVHIIVSCLALLLRHPAPPAATACTGF